MSVSDAKFSWTPAENAIPFLSDGFLQNVLDPGSYLSGILVIGIAVAQSRENTHKHRLTFLYNKIAQGAKSMYASLLLLCLTSSYF